MNMLIYCENGHLTIRKPNGLEWRHDNVDKPNLGFEYDVLIYDDIEVKIMEWKDNIDFNEQVKVALTDVEIDAIENYIENSVPPSDVTLSNQYSQQINEVGKGYIDQQIDSYGFESLVDVMAAARDGSNHPLRSDARRVLEYYDVMWNIYINVMNEVKSTREDLLPDVESFINRFPSPQKALIE